MRIAFYSPHASHLRQEFAQGGDPIFLDGLFTELRRRGHEIEVISRLNARHLWKGSVSVRSILVEALAVRRRVKKFQPDAWLVYKPSRTQPDLFGWWQRPRRYVLFAAKMGKSGRVPRLWRPFFAWAHRRSLRRADLVAAARPPSFERLLRHGVEPERLRLLPWAVPIWPMVSQDEARRHLGLPRETAIVLCASRFTPLGSEQAKTEMVLDFLSVVPTLPPEVLVVLAGDGPGRPVIEAEVRRLGLGERVRLVGAVEHAEMRSVFAACDVYVQPHSLDGIWVSVLEAQACARPVVAVRTRSGALAIDDQRTGLLADTMDEFRDHLAALTSDRARCEAMGREARKFIARCHSIDVRARQIEEFLTGYAATMPEFVDRPADDRVRA
jgi:glycosyltransferase involved in cell wall biosynthesis